MSIINTTSTEYTCVGEAPAVFRRLTPKPVRKQIFQEPNVQSPENLLMQGDAALASLKAEIADKQQEISFLMKSKVKAEEKYKDDIWNLELEKQDLLQKISDLTNSLNKSNMDLAHLEQQEKKLINELEHLKALRDVELGEIKAKHEQEVIAYRKMISVHKFEKEEALKELKRLNQKPQLRSQSVILRPASRRVNHDSEYSSSAAAVASPPQSRSMFAVSQSQTRLARDESLELSSLRLSLDQAHDIIKTMQERVNKETEERLRADALLAEAQEMVEHFRSRRNMPPSSDSTRNTVERKISKKLLVRSEQIPVGLLSEELERCHQPAESLSVKPSINLAPQKQLEVQKLKGAESTDVPIVRTELQQFFLHTVGLKPNLTKDTICQTSPQIYQTSQIPKELKFKVLDSFTNNPTVRLSVDANSKRDSASSSEKTSNYRGSVYSEKRRESKHLMDIPAVDFNTQVSLDLLLKPLSKDQIQDVLSALTRCIVGEWVWKYTRKVVGAGFSEKKHRRFFWINPYTRVLHWSSHKPGSSAQAHSKSAFVESFRIVCDNKKEPVVPYLVIKTSQRNVKIQCLDLDCHYSWVKSLSALPTDLSCKQKHFGDEEIKAQNDSSINRSSSTEPDDKLNLNHLSLPNSKAIISPQKTSSDLIYNNSTLIDLSLGIDEPLLDLDMLKNY